MDNFLQQLDARFAVDSRPVKSIMALVPSVVTGLTEDDCKSMADDLLFWDKDMPSPDALKVTVISCTYTLSFMRSICSESDDVIVPGIV